MDLRVLCVFVAVAYVDVIARITCNFQPKSWTSAMQHCLSLQGTPVDISSVLSLTGLHLNGSFWTADYARTFVAFKGDSRQSIDRCGMVDVNGNFQFVTDCVTSRYSFCEVENYTGNDLSAEQPSSKTPSSFVSQETETLTAIISINKNTTTESSDFKTGTTVQQKTETLTTTSVSINEETSTESIVRGHVSSSSASALGIGLGISLSIVVIVIITIIGVCVYKRRKRNANCEDNRKESRRTELGDIHVYDEISNNEESACDASKVDIYDKIRTDREQEHAYESVTSAPKY